MVETMEVFDRAQVRLRRDRAAAAFAAHDFLFREVAERLADRLDDIRRAFPLALDLGCHDGTVGRALKGRGGVERLVETDLSTAMAQRAGALAVVADEEALPFAEGAFDLAISCLGLHWVNDLPGALIQLRRALRTDGLVLAALFGGETLRELRACLMDAEIEEEAGASPRISPFADARDLGGLLQRAGFALPVVDVDTITVTYPDAFKLMAELRGMGETGTARLRRRSFTRKRTLLRAAALYRERYGDCEGRIPTTFQVLFATAWAPHPGQQKPLKPGQAAARLAEALDAAEQSAGEKAEP